MKRLALLICLWGAVAAAAVAESFDYVRTSGEYYYGSGTGATEAEAKQAAVADMASMIATQVSSDFTQIDDVTNRNGAVDHNSRVLNCVKTYSAAALTNAEFTQPEGKAPNISVHCYMKRSEVARLYETRIAKAKDMIDIADKCLSNGKIDMALQYYYWAYSLIRSVQRPGDVKDGQGHILVNRLPVIIDEILSDISVGYIARDGDCADLAFSYKGAPVQSLEFSYSDGRTLCQGLAKEGRGVVEMLPGYETDTYHIDIEYQYKGQARGDAELQAVLGVITPKAFPRASISVAAKTDLLVRTPSPVAAELAQAQVNESSAAVSGAAPAAVVNQNVTDDADVQKAAVGRIVEAIRSKNFSSANDCFTIDGLQLFNRLTNYGSARVLSTDNVKYYKGLNGRTVVRGLQLAFSFAGRRKKTFVEDVTLTFDPDNKVENVAFGLGKVAEDGIFNRRCDWTPQVRETIVSFMENYKTAYSLERLDYIRDIFADDAVIIVGNVVKRSTANANLGNLELSSHGSDLITYNKYTKSEYLDNLKRCFFRNDYINLKFTDHEVQWLEKFDDRKIFAINIRQEYNSSTYGDTGYLFLLVDMSNADTPQIQVRTWQPNEVSIGALYNAGDFFND